MGIDYTQSFDGLLKVSEQIRLKAEETTEAFIFSTIYPYAQHQTQMVIDKQFLANAIRKQTPSAVICGMGVELDRCPMCTSFVTSSCKYCPKCGQLLNHERKVLK